MNYDLDEIRRKDGRYAVLYKEPLQIRMIHLKDRQYEISASTKLVIAIPCDRCLKEVEYEMPIELEKKIDLDKEDAELEEGFDESDFIDGYHLDVDKMLYSEILLGWPAKVLCTDDCKGMCNVCGQNLNQGTCDCEDTSLDPRMSVVRDLFKNFKEV